MELAWPLWSFSTLTAAISAPYLTFPPTEEATPKLG